MGGLTFSAYDFYPYCPSSPPAVFPFSGRKPSTQPPAVFHPARSAEVISSQHQQQREAGGEASRLTPLIARNELRSFRPRNAKSLVANRGSRFTHSMSGANNAGSKLSACTTRQSEIRPSAVSLIELGKGGTPIASPVCRLRRHAETVTVSAPSGFRAVASRLPSTCAEVRP